jgi:hypothetical protein
MTLSAISGPKQVQQDYAKALQNHRDDRIVPQ